MDKGAEKPGTPPGNTLGLPGHHDDLLPEPGSISNVQQPLSRPRHGRKYAQVPQMGPYDPIPLPSRAAQDSAVQGYNEVRRSAPELVKAFEECFHAWQVTWDRPTHSSQAQIRCHVDEFHELVEMGPEILPLVVYKLLDRRNFTGVFLYNALENNERYLIDPSDVLNFLVLQRQNNLIIEINLGRRW
ncbi:hypothetical protein VB005_11889 [Metarhizium brunneum]